MPLPVSAWPQEASESGLTDSSWLVLWRLHAGLVERTPNRAQVLLPMQAQVRVHLSRLAQLHATTPPEE